LVLRRRYERGTSLQVDLPTATGQDSYAVVVKVIYARPVGANLWAHGCKFLSDLGDDEVFQLLPPRSSEPSIPGPMAKAVSPQLLEKLSRRETLPEVHFRLESRSGLLLDCPIRRLNIPRDWPPPPGKIQTLYAMAGSAGRLLPPLRIQVILCCPQGAFWTLRCRLLWPTAEDLAHALKS
jgi:hypothetical protein